MDTQFNNMLLRTAFSCMTCDGEISPDEVSLIKAMSDEDHLFGDIDIDNELKAMLEEINSKGMAFLKEYLQELIAIEMTKEQELALLNIAYKTILADKKIEYSEVKFFKVIRSTLKQVSDKMIEDYIVGIEDFFFAQDNNTSFSKIYDAYFQSEEIKPFPESTLTSIMLPSSHS